MKEDCEEDSIRSEKILKYFLATDDNKIEIINNLKEDIIFGEEKINLLKTYKDQTKKYIDVHNNHKYLVEVIDLGIKQEEVKVKWAIDFLDKL
ncbi:MAG: hypothetical protein SPD90_11110 [Intestinibacter sp.]|uniref:hypothetical protein n=1 Tax=Intestinibacter sp. TaxID=1965304 RepID=UPI002A80C71B|nr:hypothetical protein [Intestinibacter sp.]MDY4575598.1 hypothetical protein [Intestinibacter sp.]